MKKAMTGMAIFHAKGRFMATNSVEVAGCVEETAADDGSRQALELVRAACGAGRNCCMPGPTW